MLHARKEGYSDLRTAAGETNLFDESSDSSKREPSGQLSVRSKPKRLLICSNSKKTRRQEILELEWVRLPELMYLLLRLR